MNDINKMHWVEDSFFRLFGKTIFQIERRCTRFEGTCEFIKEAFAPDKEYFEAEFKNSEDEC